jgi:hypothetical protein
MTTPPKHVAFPVDGGCRCGKVRFRITAPPLMEPACHCTGCQKMSASAFSTTLMVPLDAFAVIAGETVPGGLHNPDRAHQHCDWCKGWIYTKLPAAVPFVNVRATLLDDPSWFAPWMESYTSEALPWAKTGATRSFAKFPEMHEYEGLMAAYRAERYPQ